MEATSAENRFLWAEHSIESIFSLEKPISWVQQPCGQMITIGFIEERPICVSFSWSLINGRLVTFYYGCSQLVDHKMIENWLKEKFSERFETMPSPSMCDANNFHLCLEIIEQENSK